MTTVLVFGAGGQVGQELMHAAWPLDWHLVGVDRTKGDITNADMVKDLVADALPAIIVNAGAYTAVDRAESEPDRARAVNEDGSRILAEAAARHGATLLHISTDYVFDGTKQGPYVESDPVAPLGVYGTTKEAGERAIRAVLPAHVILRTAWVFGAQGNNFVKTMLRVGAERSILRVVDDQLGCPTPAAAIAAALVQIAERLVDAGDRAERFCGTYHFAGREAITWAGFADAIFASAARHGRSVPTVERITTADYPTPARRPANSVLDSGRFSDVFDMAAADWRAGLDAVLDDVLAPSS